MTRGLLVTCFAAVAVIAAIAASVAAVDVPGVAAEKTTRTTPPVEAPLSRPNVVVILTDDHGYGDVGFAGYANDLATPNIDALAAQGMRFSNFYSNSNVCSPTRAALMTGRYPALVGVPGTIARDPETNMGYFAPTGPTLPELLKSVGYHTALIGKWHLGDHLGERAQNTPVQRGFDHFHGVIGAGGDYYTHDGGRYGWPGTNLMMLDEQLLSAASVRGRHATDLFTEWAEEYVRSRAASPNPFLLYLSYTAPHDPVQPPKAFLDAVLAREPGIPLARAKLVALIEHLDSGIGKVIQTLKDTGKYQNTLIVFSTDNGGYRRHAANNGPYRGGKLDFYEGGIRVPTVAVWPAKIAAATASDEVALTMDLYATIAEAAQAPITHPIEGRSLLPILLGGTATNAPRDLFFENRSTMDDTRWLTHYAVRRDSWKLLQNAPAGGYELYDLASDPYEAQDVAARHPAIVASMTDALAGYKAQEALVPWQPPIAFERGVATGLTHDWRTIDLSRRYRAPVVIVTPQYPAAGPPIVVRMRDLDDLSVDHPRFEIRLQRVDPVWWTVPPIDTNYLVIEAGVYNTAHHGITLEAMRFDSRSVDYADNWKGTSRKYVNSYTRPVVLGQVLSYNSRRFSTFWSRGATAGEGPDASELFVGKHVGEDPSQTRSAETLGYVVAEAGLHTLGGEPFESGVSNAIVAGIEDTPPYSVPVSGANTPTAAFVTQMGMKGESGSWAVLYGPNPVAASGIGTAIDRLRDTRRPGVPEQVGYFVFGRPSETPAVPTGAPALAR